ncbi:MAG: type II secretion system secretin GspD [Candidatus Rokubacteria bacterium]|nr:type II secretion system secretin GspD [Candidatus Rokubacteria bacterium]
MTGVRRAAALLLLAGLAAACASSGTRVVTPPPLRLRPPASATTPAPSPAPEPQRPGAAEPGAQTPGSATAPPSPPGTSVAPAAPPTARPAPGAPTGRGRQIVLNFDNADIEAVIQAASEIAGFNYTIGPGVAGKKVTVQTSSRIPEDEVLNVLLAVLEVNGVTMVRSGNLYKIVPLATARERPVPTIIGAQPDPSRAEDQVITQIVPLTYAPADRIAGTIRPFVQGGNVVVHGSLLIVTDTAGNIARLLRIVQALDVEVTTDELRIVQVRYADAVEIAKILNDFFAGRRARTATPAAPAVPRAVTPGIPGVPAVAGDGAERPPLVIADKRTNSLIVSARRTDLDIIVQLLGQLDVDTQANKRVFVYYVENVKAKDLAATLTEIFGRPSREAETGAAARERRDVPPAYPGAPPGVTPVTPTPAGAPGAAAVAGAEAEPGVVEGQVKVVADEPNNALIITTFPRNWPLIEDTIRKLDRTPKQVLIEVLVAEISLDDENDLGLEWTLRTQQNVSVGGQPYNVGSVSRVDVGAPGPALPGSTPTLPGLPVLVPPFQGFSFFLFETDRFLGLLNLYANYGKVNVLSSPHILTSENKKAIINVSQSVPIVTQFTGAQPGTVVGTTQQPPTTIQSSNVEYRDAGIILTVTPRISDKRVVALDIKQTVNDIGAQQPPSGSPIIIKREAETSVVLHDNQTLVLGGLIQTRRENTQSGIPGLSRIPVVGFLFGKARELSRRTELIMLITPRVIGDPSEARELLEQIRAQRPDLVRNLRGHPSILRPETVEPLAPAEPPSAAPPGPPLPQGGPSER